MRSSQLCAGYLCLTRGVHCGLVLLFHRFVNDIILSLTRDVIAYQISKRVFWPIPKPALIQLSYPNERELLDK